MRSAWRQAAIVGDTPTLVRLLAEGADLNARDRFGQTALMLSARHGRAQSVRFLLDNGAERDVTAKFGLSALMLAIVNRHHSVARDLVDRGADLSLRGRGAPGFAGKTAYDLASEAGQPDLAAHIRLAERQSGPSRRWRLKPGTLGPPTTGLGR
jgi:ankyrin repeat protein